jgi:hypothetical protein
MPPSETCAFGKWSPELKQVWKRYDDLTTAELGKLPKREGYTIPAEADPRFYEEQRIRAKTLRQALEDIVPDQKRQHELYAMHVTNTDHLEEERFLFEMFHVLKGADCIPDDEFQYWNIQRTEEMHGKSVSVLTI